MAPNTDIAHWRTQIFSRLLSIVLVLGLITAVPSIALAAKEGLWSLIVADVLAIGWMLAIWRLRTWSYQTRVLHFLLVVFFVGASMLMNIGEVAQIYLIAPPVFAAVLLGRTQALVALAISGALIFGLSVSGNVHVRAADPEAHKAATALIVAINFLFIGALVTVSCGTLLQKLTLSLAESHRFARSLEDGKDALSSVNAELRLNAAAVAQLNDMVLIASASRAEGEAPPIIFANDAFVRGTGYAREAVLGRSLTMFTGAQTDPAELARITEAMKGGAPTGGELLVYTSAGSPCWIEMEVVPFVDEAGVHTHWVVVARDVSERKKAATAIRQLAFFDVLTGLPNRRMLTDRLGARIAAALPGSGLGAVLFIDLDNFKFINDARGHATGDILLRSAASRLSRLMRKDDVVARLGGDEFVVLLADLGDDPAGATAAALRVAEKIRHTLTQPFVIDEQSYNSSASIGVTLVVDSAQTVEDVLREADTAMYRAKSGGRNNVAFFEEQMQAESQRRLTLERELAAALANGELSMYTQLQVDTEHQPTGAELLMRWRRADGSMVAPDVFIPIAEATGQIVALGHWALEQACAAWHALHAAGHALPLSVNVSPSQFRQPDFVERVRQTLAETRTPPAQLIFEITEGLLIDNLDATIGRMQSLADMGVGSPGTELEFAL